MSAASGKRSAGDAATDLGNDAKRAKSSSDSAAVSASPFARLSPDLIGTVCTFLPVTDLCSLRCVSHAWSSGSRSARAWSTSALQVDGWTYGRSTDSDEQPDTTERLEAIQAAAPHLRSIIMPIELMGAYSEGVDMGALGQAHPLLEHLVLRRATAANLPEAEFKHLHHLMMSDGKVYNYDDRDDEEGNLTEEDVEAIGAQAGLISLRLVCPDSQIDDIFDALSNGTHAGSWLILQLARMASSIPEEIDPDCFGRFASLEELTLDEVEPRGDRPLTMTHENLRSLSSLPSLRLLTIGEKMRDEDLAVLLSSDSDADRPLAPRLEHLGLVSSRTEIGPASIALIASECTALISLVVIGHDSMALRALTREEWSDRTVLREDRDPPAPLTYEEATTARIERQVAARAAARAAAEAAGETPPEEDEWKIHQADRTYTLDFGVLLTAPVAFRRRLRFLCFWKRAPLKPAEERAMVAQAGRCMPNLVLAQFRPPDRGLIPADTPMRLPQDDPDDSDWLPRETAVDPDDATVTSTPAGASLSTSEANLLAYTPFHLLRAVKVAARLLLHPSEARDELARPYTRPPESEE